MGAESYLSGRRLPSDRDHHHHHLRLLLPGSGVSSNWRLTAKPTPMGVWSWHLSLSKPESSCDSVIRTCRPQSHATLSTLLMSQSAFADAVKESLGNLLCSFPLCSGLCAGLAVRTALRGLRDCVALLQYWMGSFGCRVCVEVEAWVGVGRSFVEVELQPNAERKPSSGWHPSMCSCTSSVGRTWPS